MKKRRKRKRGIGTEKKNPFEGAYFKGSRSEVLLVACEKTCCVRSFLMS